MNYSSSGQSRVNKEQRAKLSLSFKIVKFIKLNIHQTKSGVEYENQKQSYAKKSVKRFQPKQEYRQISQLNLNFENTYALKVINQELRKLRDHEGHLKLTWYRNQFGIFYEVRIVDNFQDKHRQAETLRNVCTWYD